MARRPDESGKIERKREYFSPHSQLFGVHNIRIMTDGGTTFAPVRTVLTGRFFLKRLCMIVIAATLSSDAFADGVNCAGWIKSNNVVKTLNSKNVTGCASLIDESPLKFEACFYGTDVDVTIVKRKSSSVRFNAALASGRVFHYEEKDTGEGLSYSLNCTLN